MGRRAAEWRLLLPVAQSARRRPGILASARPLIDDGAKVGHSGSGSAFVGSVQSEAAFLNRKNDGTPFFAVWQNVPDELGSEPIYRVLDEMIKNWP